MPSIAYAIDRLAQRYEVTVIPYIYVKTDAEKVAENDSHAKFEPTYGCYTGAFIDHEDSIHGTYRDEYGNWRRDVTAFNHLTDTHHAIFFMYMGYGRQFPNKWIKHLNDNGAAAQIALEPTKLEDVQDDAYLHEFARQAKASKVPIFLRFASEMNGDWVPYHGNPALYVEKYRLVAKVMHDEAPNVAMVWCVFETPVSSMADYYPGKDAVDWVGINIYSVPFWDNDPKRGAEWRNPSDSLRYVYDRYATRHPIMICEYGASHRSSLDMIGRSQLAQTKMSQMYASLPREYPRVKAICWLSMNAITHAIPGRQTNDYSLLQDDAVRRRYHDLTRDPYYLAKVPKTGSAVAKQQAIPLVDGQVVKGRVALSAWVKLYDDSPRVIWKVNDKVMLDSTVAGPHRWVLDGRKFDGGPATVSMEVYDEAGRQVAVQSRQILVTH